MPPPLLTNKKLSPVKYAGFLLITLFLLFAVLPISAESVRQNSNKTRPVVGLVLSGGGARGAAHVGVLKVLEELRIPVDIITGTSMGAVTGGLYAYGYSASELETRLINTDWNALFVDNPPRAERSLRRKADDYDYLIKLEAGFRNGRLVLPTGLIQGQKLDMMLKEMMPDMPRDFDALPIRYRAVAEDIETGEAVAMAKGDMASAMRASMAIPGVFAPVSRDGRLLVDGGFANNLPVQLARQMGAQVLIVVDLSGKLPKRDKLTSPLSIINQNMGFMINRNTQQQLASLAPEDILLQPTLEGFSSTDFWRVKEMIEQGVLAAKSKSSQLQTLSVSEEVYQGYLTLVRVNHKVSVVIDRIIINNESKFSKQVIKSFITQQPGETLDIKMLQRDLQRLYGLHVFERISYETRTTSAGTLLTINVREKNWGPHYLRFGMNLESDFEGWSAFNLASSLTSTPLNVLGGEWRTELQIGHDQYISTEFYQPLDYELNYFISIMARYSETHFATYESGKQVTDYKSSSSTVRLSAGRIFGNQAQIQVGVIKGEGDLDLLIGRRPAPEPDFKVGTWYSSFFYDQLDDINFPKHGILSSITWLGNRESLGARADQDSAGINLIWANTWGRHTTIFWTGLAAVVNSNVPTQNNFALGGFMNLSGYRKNELTGRYAGIARIVYFNQVSGGNSILNIPVYLGGTLESGNTWNDKNDISTASLRTAGSLVLAFETPVGPLYLAKGFAEGGRSAYYLFLGRSFTLF